MSDHLITGYARQRAATLVRVARPERHWEREARLSRRPRRRWTAR